MTLSAKYPNLTRRAFARSRGAIFPACHAYCPLCAHEDQRLHGETILRAANAGLWRVSCRRHRCLLDSAEREDEVRPHADVAERVWLNGANKSHRPAVAAAPVALAIERALERTAAGRDPGPEWLERDPNRFNDAARVLSNVVLVTRRAGSDRPSPAWALLGARYPDLYGLGVADYRPSLLRELPAWLRVRAIVAAGRLLLAPSAFEHFGEDLWWSPPFSQRDFVGRPWRVATGAMSLALCEALWPTSADWSGPLRQEIRAVVRDRLAQVGKPAPR